MLTDAANREKDRERSRRYHAANREKVAEKDRRYYLANREIIAERDRRYYLANRERLLESGKRWRDANRDKIAESNHSHRESRRAEIAEQSRQYYESNRTREIDRQRRYKEGIKEAWGTEGLYHRQNAISKHLAEQATVRGEWSQAEDKYLLKNWNHPLANLAADLGRTYGSIKYARRRLIRDAARESS